MPLTGGARMKIELQARARKWASRSVDVGFFDAEHATIASINEYGAPAGPKNGRIPPRPFMRRAVFENVDGWRKALAARLIDGDTSRQALESTGDDMAQDIRVSLGSGRFFANAIRTVQMKGFNFPLLLTGQFLGPAIKRRVK